MAIDTGRPERAMIWQFLPFVLTSGVGWLIDLCILLLLTGLAGVAPFAANIASSLIASSLVYCFAHRSIYAAPSADIGRPLFAYVAYSFVVILAASAVVGRLAMAFAHLPTSLLLAKIVVTPPLLLMNFAVSRGLAFGARRG